MAIKKVGVLGCGLMGSGIAQVAAQAGYEVVVREVEQKFLDKGLSGIQKSLAKFVPPEWCARYPPGRFAALRHGVADAGRMRRIVEGVVDLYRSAMAERSGEGGAGARSAADVSRSTSETISRRAASGR